MRSPQQGLLLGEWACLGIIYPAPTHGFAVAAHLKPAGDIGRVWSLSRALTYRSLEQLASRDYIRPIGEEPGIAGGNRTILAATRTGRAQLRTWLGTPVAHLRDLRSELLLKLILAEHCGVDMEPMLLQQRAHIEQMAAAITAQSDPTAQSDSAARSNPAARSNAAGPTDVVALWRSESSNAALRFVDRLLSL
ncbi:MAG TPA: hypothetical protein PLS72_15520 [Ilumatobacteraceae bacterium]|nr:hypothetical protein [Ilumatobacteraceae bacterium]